MRTHVIYTPERRNRLFERFGRRFGTSAAPRISKPGYALWRVARRPAPAGDRTAAKRDDGGLSTV